LNGVQHGLITVLNLCAIRDVISAFLGFFMEALNSLGIDWKLLLAQVINFLILLFLLTRFLYKPIVKMLDDRSEKVSAGLKAAEKSQKDLAKAETDAEKIREKAYKEANEILTDAEKEADAISSNIVDRAKSQADEIRKYAAEEALSSKDEAMREAKNELSNLVTLALGRIIGEQLDEATKQKLTDKAIRDMK
jgi:F-type H+-transporting ATPase subunit b